MQKASQVRPDHHNTEDQSLSSESVSQDESMHWRLPHGRIEVLVPQVHPNGVIKPEW